MQIVSFNLQDQLKERSGELIDYTILISYVKALCPLSPLPGEGGAGDCRLRQAHKMQMVQLTFNKNRNTLTREAYKRMLAWGNRSMSSDNS